MEKKLKTVGTMDFKKFSGTHLENFTDYIKNYIKDNESANIEIIIGTD